METSKRGDAEKAMNDLGDVVREGEKVLEAAAGEGGDQARELRAKLEVAVAKAKAVYLRLQEQTVAAAKATDKAVRDHPYHAVGIAFGVGLLIGVLAVRCRGDAD